VANRVIPQGTGKRAAFVTHQRPALGTIQAELDLTFVGNLSGLPCQRT